MKRKLITDHDRRCTRFEYHATGRELLIAAGVLIAVASILTVIWGWVL